MTRFSSMAVRLTQINHPRGIALLGILVWVVFVVFLGLLPYQPQLPLRLASQETLSRGAHFVVHYVLGLLVYLALAPPQRPEQRFKAALLAFGFSGALGVGVEGLHAVLQERTSAFQDVVLDLAGAASGACSIVALEWLKVDRSLLVTGASVTVLTLIGVTSYGEFIWEPRLPRVGDYWWAPYQVSICGDDIPPMPRFSGNVHTGDIHTHGLGLIYVHPEEPEDAGANANLGQFFVNMGGSLADSGLTLPDGETYTNGDECPGGGLGRIVVKANGRKVVNPGSYVPREHERIQIDFRMQNECESVFLGQLWCGRWRHE